MIIPNIRPAQKPITNIVAGKDDAIVTLTSGFIIPFPHIYRMGVSRSICNRK